jgi:uncharacterized membrane protein
LLAWFSSPPVLIANKMVQTKKSSLVDVERVENEVDWRKYILQIMLALGSITASTGIPSPSYKIISHRV